MVWYRFWKKSGPMQGLRETYRYFEEDQNKKTLKTWAEEWADRMPGGHNTSYNYGWEKVEVPPKEWLETQIKYIGGEIGKIRDKIVVYKRELKINY